MQCEVTGERLGGGLTTYALIGGLGHFHDWPTAGVVGITGL